MTTGESNHFQPTADSVFHDMLTREIGPDNPMTDEAVEAGMKAVRARIDGAKEILEGAPITEERSYDSEAMAYIALVEDEKREAELKAGKRQEVIESFPPSATGYLEFLNYELAATQGAIFFSMHHPAPPDMTAEQLELIAEDVCKAGYKAEVAPLDNEVDDSLLGIKVESAS